MPMTLTPGWPYRFTYQRNGVANECVHPTREAAWECMSATTKLDGVTQAEIQGRDADGSEWSLVRYQRNPDTGASRTTMIRRPIA